jgi:hypothetical protein
MTHILESPFYACGGVSKDHQDACIISKLSIPYFMESDDNSSEMRR